MMSIAPGPQSAETSWLDTPAHRGWLKAEALRQFAFFRASIAPTGGFYVLDQHGVPLQGGVQELHTTTRLIHSYALGKISGVPDCDAIINQGMAYLFSRHRDAEHGGYAWALNDHAVADGRKLAYGHVFVLLAGASAKAAGHPDADRLIADVEAVLDRRFWEEEHGLFCDEWCRDWTPFSTYRGMNANMHGVEALLAAYEATGREKFLAMAGRILDFFMGKIGPGNDWRFPEHYTQSWEIDRDYAGNPMFRPAGTTPGHSFELARLLLQHWDLTGRPEGDACEVARRVAYLALKDAWDEEKGGFVYTLDFDGRPAIRARYWWPVTEAIGALAAMLKCCPSNDDENWYRRLWCFADEHFIDRERGGWFPELGEDNMPADHQFKGKPDIYHSIQATLFPLTAGVSRAYDELNGQFQARGVK